IVTYDGKTYHTVQIGSQCWLKENLDVGVMIQGTENASNNGVIEKYCYDNDLSNCTTYGGLYQWNEAMSYNTSPGTKGICPTGWHIPTYAEYGTLKAEVNNDGNTLKEVGQGTGNGIGTNISGFSALLVGWRYYENNNVSFVSLRYNTYFWTSTKYDEPYAYDTGLEYDNSGIHLSHGTKEFGFSIRCLKD
ncbi:MAG: FISUMP domain-containing protein, partial [Ignavibacteriaceae bacterium]|nr:FISUMP domain-containing protein [Ignavibacteriaceae bacterium]